MRRVQVKVTIVDELTNSDYSYGGTMATPSIKVPLCLSGRKEEGETGVDCGGVCVRNRLAYGSNPGPNDGKCKAGEKCAADDDCQNGIACSSGVCGQGDGKSKSSAGWSCRSLQIEHKYDKINDGYYWVKVSCVASTRRNVRRN